ncbi:type I restriction endonuclease subunit R [Clostridium botulinum]|uniref:Type I restriction enzyme endonuclease subunit n=1 Tax=Clostridium botulinum TaxID=1491 RepID=A0A846J3H7_CLOBO|nr:type I restriction endonuclease subunit R [Clostridium botulinum]ACA55536.1 putative type I site-specific deoxyribonuclease, HsdR family subfamily [Clostridium botulinum A3 str. Loch Maree]NFH64705.1 type I restriction endonuclease subunit R [Clostridium botulinum]NFJ08519.1 type I restriction endonuclease subunit R [Clostridium botulinum]NFK14915.1 type I restriction endonuclease subunit R [Clostridium botulinum]NFM95249.1 type I restriction endonuclease subunit R [Clostridium botulinum]
MAYQSEAELEKQLIKQLESKGYNKVKISTEEELIKNFRVQLNKYNEEKLAGTPLTDKEFERVMRKVEGKSIFEGAKILRDKWPLKRDDGLEVYIEFFNSKSLCKNIFQVTTQTTVVGKYTNRYDVTLLVNGLPLVQIELKRRGVDFKEAFNQIQRYRKHSYQGLYRYIQIFIVSNGMDTKYFSNSDRDILYTHTFFWTDEKNQRISKLNDFTDTFLERSFISKIIARYMIINYTEKILMVMRPYQIYAVEALINRALETNGNGYIWHTTGSGKTLTSFKASQILSKEPKIKKVFFLVDRKDLDSQTINEFNKFEPKSVDVTDKTSTLIKQIKDVNKPLIVTTIQKMANAIKSPRYTKIMEQYKDEKVAFIIDECHRSQFGSMHIAIEKHFKKAQYFGFTGTPILKENKSQDGRTTADLFDEMLHSYLIKDAIKDNNVLGFSVEYISTFKGQFDENDDTKVKAIDKKEAFMDDERISQIAQDIIKNHNKKTKDRQYTAIFAVESIEMLVKYYDKFKKLDHNLKITGIFSYGVNEDAEGKDEHSRDSLEEIIKDYNEMFDTKYSTDTFQGYFANVSKKVKSGQIDILIVVNMFLTGFDSKTLNTLYIDKNLAYHSLIQAYSRTNRVYKSTKPYGNIVCYRNLKKKTDEAIKLFSLTDNANEVLMKSYNHYLEAFKESVLNLYKIVPRPEDVDFIEGEKEKKEFIVAFRELSKILIKLQTFVEFEFDEDKLLISEQTYQDFKSKYLAIYDSFKNDEEGKASILDDIDFGIELMHTDKINVDYIMNLIRNIDFSDKENKEKDIKHIIKELDRADSEHLRLKVDLLKSFLQEVVPNLTEEDSIDDAYSRFEQVQRTEEIKAFSEQAAVKEGKLKDYISEYEYSGMLDRKDMGDTIEGSFLKRKKVVNKITTFIKNHVEKFS